MFDQLLDGLSPEIFNVRTKAKGPEGTLPIDEKFLLERPSGDLFGLTQSAGMGWKASELGGKQFLILSTAGGVREADGSPAALGYHTGHWEISELVKTAAREFKKMRKVPFAAHVSDPCDGRSQGTTGMFDSLPFRNDAAIVFQRLIRSLPTRHGVMGVATCDKGLPAMMMALAGSRDLPGILVPGGVTLATADGEDTAMVQTLGARFSHGLVSLQTASEMGCRACASPGGGCQFLGTAATSQVVAEALGIALPHSALAPSGEPVWHDMAARSARALVEMEERGIHMSDLLTQESLHNSMVVFAAFGGSTNLLLHIPAIAFKAGLKRPTVEDWIAVNRKVPRLVSVLPNGPVHHPTVRVFLAGGVPEVMLHLRELGLLNTDVITASGKTLGENLDWWAGSERRKRFKEILFEQDAVRADDVIMAPELARERGLTSTVTFPKGNIAPEGSVVKSTAIDAALLRDGVYQVEWPVRVFPSEAAAMKAIKQQRIQPQTIMVLAGIGPMGTGMEETYQVTSALKHLPFGKQVALITDARFSGVSTGACIGHVGPEGLAGGPIGKLQDGDIIRIVINCRNNEGSIDFIGDASKRLTPEEGAAVLAQRPTRPDLQPHPSLPPETRLWAALQGVSGGTWAGCVYDTEAILDALKK